MPEWTALLLLAEAWGTPPDVLEETLSAKWFDRWAALQEARANSQPKQIGGQASKKRLI